MADIKFEEDDQYSLGQQIEQKPFFIRLILSSKIASTDTQAEYIIIGIIGAFILISIYLVFSSGSSVVPHNPYKEGQSYLLPPEASTP